MTTNPLLDHDDLPRFSAVKPEHVGPAVDAVIADHRAAMTECTRASDFAGVFLAKERADGAMSRMWQVVSHLTMVSNTPEMRAAHEAAQPVLSAYGTSVEQNRDLFDAIARIPREGLTPAERRAVDLTIRGFELSGVALEPAPRARFAEITVKLGQLATAFSNAVMDATEAWTLHVADRARLAGINDADLAMLRAQAEAKQLDGWLIDLHFPSVRAVLTYADDRELRRTVYEAFNTKASDQGPHAGTYDNSARIDEILMLRQEAAGLLGFDTPVAWSVATKMARDAGEIERFLLDLSARAHPQALAEIADLRRFAQDRLGVATLEPWDIGYVSEKLRIERHSIDEAAIKRHLPLPRVLDGLFGLLRELYRIEAEPVDTVDTWHPDVRYYALRRQGETAPFAGIYFDLFARSGKNGGAWMDVCRPRLRDADTAQMPVAFLNCNYGKATGDEPAYLSHSDMVTLFHEMGHCLHHVLTEVDIPSIGGISGVEWDAVELPSQFMENFAWEPAMLRQVSAQAETGAPLSDEMIERMLGARRFLGGMALARQIEFALFDIRLHLAAADPDGPSATEILHAVREEVAVVQPPAWNRFAHSFSHIFAGGYASGYYSYLWAERLSADAFEPFVEAGADRIALGEAFREHVLSRGGTRTAAENFAAFRGRDPDSGALLRSWGLAA